MNVILIANVRKIGKNCSAYKIFFCKILNQMKATTPFSMLERLIAHQTPVIPSPAAASPMAKGMRKVLHEMLMIAGGTGSAGTVEHALRGNLQHHEDHRISVDPEKYTTGLISGLLRHDQREDLATVKDE